jgi:hypothetical protein
VTRAHGGDCHDKIAARIREIRGSRQETLTGENVRTERLFRQQRVGQVAIVVIDPVLHFDATPDLSPPDDRIAILLRKRGIRGDVIERGAVGKQPPALGPAGVLACERQLFLVDHASHARQRPRKDPPISGVSAVTVGAVGTPERGVYLTFCDEDARSRDLPTVGPYDEVVIRGARVVAERDHLDRMIAAHASNGRWLEAEAQSIPSYGVDAADATRGNIRIAGGEDDVSLRFFDDDAGSPEAPTQGPFVTVVIGPHEIRADDGVLAVRISPMSPWLLTDRAGAAVQGVAKTAIAVTASAATSPRIRPEFPRATPPTPEPPKSEEPAPAVWVDRVRAPSEIYISRPDRSAKR